MARQVGWLAEAYVEGVPRDRLLAAIRATKALPAGAVWGVENEDDDGILLHFCLPESDFATALRWLIDALAGQPVLALNVVPRFE